MSTCKRMWTDREVRSMAVKTVEEKEKLEVFEHIVDKDGHPRFIEGSVSLNSRVEGSVTKLYGKWSLSGSHLMMVFSGSASDTTAITAGALCQTDNLPKWISDKIVVLFASNSLANATITWYADNYSTQTNGCTLQKLSLDGNLSVYSNAVTLTADRKFRLQFDLLIDDDE